MKMTCHPRSEDSVIEDDLACGCPCLNGPIPIVTTQVLVFIGWLFTLIALGDCNFVQVPGGVLSDALVELYPASAVGLSPSDAALPLLGVGFFAFEKADHRCYWYRDSNANNDEILQTFIKTLGNSWTTGRIVGSITPSLSLLLWLYLLSYSCSAQPRLFRYGTAFILCVVLVILQGLTFTVLGSSWCDENGCVFARASGFSIGAMVCFFLAGICFLNTVDFTRKTVSKEIDYDEGVTGTGTNLEDEQDLDIEENQSQESSKYYCPNGWNGEDDEVSEFGMEVSLDGSLYIEESVTKVMPKSILKNSRNRGHEF